MKALSYALPARLGALTYTSVYGATKVTSSTRKRLTVSLSANKSKQPGTTPSFYISLSRGKEQHAWSFRAPKSSFAISAQAAGKVVLAPTKTAGMGKIALRVRPDGPVKAQRCGGKVYAKTRNVIISGTFFFDTRSKWGKVGSKAKPFRFRTTHRVYFSYNVTCPPTVYPDTCYNSLSWSASRSTANTNTYVTASRRGTKSAIYAYRTTALAKPKGASRSDSVWGTGPAPVLTVAPDDSATMKVHGVRGSGVLADPNPGWTYDDPCDTGTQHYSSWSTGTVTNDAKPIRIPAQVFGALTVPNGTAGYMSRAWFD